MPCIARWPGKLPRGKISHQPGIMMDWSATILKLAGAKPPKDRSPDGVDLLPMLAGEQRARKRTLFWRRVGANFVETHRAVRDDNWESRVDPPLYPVSAKAED